MKFSVPVVAFSAEPLDAGSACVAVLDVPGNQSALPEVERARVSGAPVVLACRPGRLEWWRQGTSTETTTIQQTIPAPDVASFFGRVGPRLGPRAVFRAKTIARIDRTYQLDFVDFGLLPLLEEQAGDKLAELIEGVLTELRTACGKVPEDRTLFMWVFRLLAGKLLHDKQVPAFASVDLTDPQAVFSAVATHLDSPVEHAPLHQPAATALAAAARRLEKFSPLAHVTTRTLAHLYETGLLSKKKAHNDFRKKWGIHNTPWWLADYLVWKTRDWVAEWPLGGRRVIDPGCGAGTLLVSAVGLLRELATEEGVARDEIVRHLREAIEGFDRDTFGLEIARLSLTLADLPNPDGWKLDTADLFGPDVIAKRVSRCPIVFANPPFENFTREDRAHYRGLAQTNKAAELVARLVAGLPSGGILGLVPPKGFLHAAQSEATRRTLLEQFEIREITLFPDKVFGFSDAEACVVLARRKTVSQSAPVRFRWVREPDIARFEHDYGVTAEQFTTTARFLRSTNSSLRIPQLDEVWECCAGLPKFRDVAQIEKGLEYKGKAGLPPNAVTISEQPFPAATKGFAKLEPHKLGLHEFPRERWMSLDTALIRRPGSGTQTGTPQVLLNYMPVSRGPWRLKAFLDAAGQAVTSQFLTVRARSSETPLEFLWAVCNSSYANAFAYANSTKRHVLAGTVRAMPFPMVTAGDAERIRRLVREYIAAAEQIGSDQGPLFASGGRPQPVEVDRLLKRVDAEVLRLYHLPPRFERRLLDLFDALPERHRPGVPVVWSRYYPEWFQGPASYHLFLTDEDGAKVQQPDHLPVDKFVRVIRDATLPTPERATMLLDLARSGAPEAAKVVEGLLAQALPESAEWMKAVLAAAEEVQFPEPEQQQRARSRLIDWAMACREGHDQNLTLALKSALRRYATLVPVDEVGRLIEFLRPQDRSASWLVTLLGIQNVFGAAPPARTEEVEALSARVFSIAKELVAERRFQAGEESTLTVEAIRTLVILGAPSSLQVAKDLATRAPSWLRHVLAERVAEMLQRWREGGALDDNTALRGAQAVLSILLPSGSES